MMKTSAELVELLGELLSKHDKFRMVDICCDGKIAYTAKTTDSLLVKIHEMSMTYAIGDMQAYSLEFWPYLSIYLQPSTDGQTNMDVAFIEKLSELTIIPIDRERQ